MNSKNPQVYVVKLPSSIVTQQLKKMGTWGKLYAAKNTQTKKQL